MLRLATITMTLIAAIACSGTHSVDKNTTITVDYYGIRESTIGLGWDNPLNVERLVLAEVDPIAVIFAEVDNKESEALVSEIVLKGLKEKVWVIDKANPVSKLIHVILDAKSDSVPLMVFKNKSIKHVLVGKGSIIKFLKLHGFALKQISDKEYY